MRRKLTWEAKWRCDLQVRLCNADLATSGPPERQSSSGERAFVVNVLGLQQWKGSGRFPTVTASALSVETGSPPPALKLAALTSADKTPSRGEVNDLHPKLVSTGSALVCSGGGVVFIQPCSVLECAGLSGCGWRKAVKILSPSLII